MAYSTNQSLMSAYLPAKRFACWICAALIAFGSAAARADSVGVEDLRAFADAWGYIRSHYVEDIDDRHLLEAAIRGMMAALDEHSSWLSPRDLEGVEEQASGRYGGLGVRLLVLEDHLQVVSAMDGSPADRAGLRPGDRIVAIDETPLTSDNTREASDWLRGPPGTQIALTVERDDTEQALEVALTRELIRRSSVNLQPLPDQLALVRLEGFQHATALELDDLLSPLANELNGLILDLRDNPGGMLNAAVAVSDRFLSQGLVVYAEGRNGANPMQFFSQPGELLPGVPVVVLVNGQSASAAEIVAGALQDHGRAVILGEPTFGKGSVQTIWPLRNGGGIRLTTAHYFTPSGRRIQGRGIEPDILAGESVAALPAEDQDPWLIEAVSLLQNAERLYRGSGRLAP